MTIRELADRMNALTPEEIAEHMETLPTDVLEFAVKIRGAGAKENREHGESARYLMSSRYIRDLGRRRLPGTAATVTVLLGDGTGDLTQVPGSPFPVVLFADSVAVGDFNGDGKLDIAIAAEGVTVLLVSGIASLHTGETASVYLPSDSVDPRS